MNTDQIYDECLEAIQKIMDNASDESLAYFAQQGDILSEAAILILKERKEANNDA